MSRSLKKGPFVDEHLKALGVKTRAKKKASNKLIVRRRNGK